MLDKYRFNGLFHVVIDGTNLYSTRVNLGEQAIQKFLTKMKIMSILYIHIIRLKLN